MPLFSITWSEGNSHSWLRREPPAIRSSVIERSPASTLTGLGPKCESHDESIATPNATRVISNRNISGGATFRFARAMREAASPLS